MKLTKLADIMVDIVREIVERYQTDIAYDIAILAGAKIGSTWAWMLRKNGTCIADCTERPHDEAVAPYYDTFNITKEYTIKKTATNTYEIEEVA